MARNYVVARGFDTSLSLTKSAVLEEVPLAVLFGRDTDHLLLWRKLDKGTVITERKQRVLSLVLDRDERNNSALQRKNEPTTIHGVAAVGFDAEATLRSFSADIATRKIDMEVLVV